MEKKRSGCGPQRWLDALPHSTAEVLVFHDLENAEDVLDLRVFDLLNLYRVGAGRAEHILVGLYQTLNPNSLVDSAMEYGEIRQPFRYSEWNRRNRNGVLVCGGAHR